MRRPGALPLFVQTLGLVIVTLIAAQTAAVVVILSLPPPVAEVYTVGDIVQTVRALDSGAGRHVDTPLVTRFAAAPPALDIHGPRRVRFRTALGKALSVSPSSIVVEQPQPPLIRLGGARPRFRPDVDMGNSDPLLIGRFAIGIRQADGRWLVVEPKSGFGLDPWQERLLLVFGLTVLAVAPLAWAFSRRLAAPISLLAAGAERLGRDPGAPPLEVRGSAEVSAAVMAFNQMQERIRRYVNDRTSMIGAIAHDLRTPLTRLRFRIEAVPDPLRSKLQSDIDQMEAMVSSTLGFVRDASVPRDRRKLEIASLVETVMDEAALTGADAAVDRADRVVVDGDPLALKRLMTNLVDNALKYGASARARVFVDGEMAVITIDDRGPGMPVEEIERVFEPFHRLEGSRSRETGGIGLGLAVVRAVARSHGGDVVLKNRAGGGLTARVSLPMALNAVQPA